VQETKSLSIYHKQGQVCHLWGKKVMKSYSGNAFLNKCFETFT